MIQERLAKIQKELKAPKNQYNAFGKYNYRNCEDILEAVKPLLGEAILTLDDEIVQRGDRYYVRAIASLSMDKECISCTAYAREELDKKGMDAAQITGACSSYARKYALNGLFLIDDTKDADAKDNAKDEKPPKKDKDISPREENPPTVTPEGKNDTLQAGSALHKKIEVMITEAKIDRELLKKWLVVIGWLEEKDGKLSFNNLSEKRASQLVDKWDSAIKTFGQWVDQNNAS